MQFVFDTLRDMHVCLKPSLCISVDSCILMSDTSISSIKQLVSSANKIDVRRVDTMHKSLTYSKNNDVPRI